MSHHRPSHTPHRKQGIAQALHTLIDEHLAWQIDQSERELERPSSAGTMFVDWDGVGEPKITYRKENSRHDSVLSPYADSSSVGLGITSQYDGYRSPPGLYVAGYEPTTSFTYAYNGNDQVMHVYRDAVRPLSEYSEYYAVDAATWAPTAPLRLLGVWVERKGRRV